MTRLTRRQFSLATAAMACLSPAMAAGVRTVKIGYQKTGLPVIAQQQKTIETALAPLSTGVEWVEFSAGPPLVEALNVGAIHLGWTGDAPPIFGQAAGAAIRYVAALPSSGQGEAIFAKPESGLKTVADLKGRKVAVGKGTSANNLLVAALEANGLNYSDVEPVYLSPADGGAAFASDKVDAWAVWDPFFAIAELRYKPTILVRTSDVLKVNSYFLANRDFPADNAEAIAKVLDALREASAWADAHRDKVAQALHDVTGVPLAAQTLAAERQEFGIFPLTDDIIAEQQATADRFHRIGLIAQQITVADAVWRGQ
ncbi:sulfonate ABC transporter substrate-binding protein [Paenirhodobacter sp.]|uniref:sulfonate ABC transporter substrate-binding protein n=1 Tax=Paenirhodobacter sp. TaxID=1965326 RepID=UPI003B3E955F